MDVGVNLVEYYGFTPFMLACRYGSTETVKLMLGDDRVDVNFVDKCGWTPLMWSCHWGRTQTVWELIKCPRIDLYWKTTRKFDYYGIVHEPGSTALDIARSLREDEKEDEVKREQYNEIIALLDEEMSKRKQG